MTTLDEQLKKRFESLSAIKSSNRLPGIATGYSKIDWYTGGLRRGQLAVISGEASSGKSALALAMAEFAALSNHKVAYISFESSAQAIVTRLISSNSGISLFNIERATIGSQEWIQLTNVAARLADAHFYILDSHSRYIDDVCQTIDEHKFDVVFIDSISYLKVRNENVSAFVDKENITQELKQIAKVTNTALVVVADLNTPLPRRPQLKDISFWNLNRHADTVYLIYRDVMYDPEAKNPAFAEICIAKQRGGPSGEIFNFNFIRDLVKFEDASE